jgi:uncharacterized protein with HEPN domain
LRDIQEAIIKIEKYAVRGKQVFENDELIQIWIIHHLQIIGEASASMSKPLSLSILKFLGKILLTLEIF